jgi:hypothetical protein
VSAADPGPAWSAWSQLTPVAVVRGAGTRYVRVRIPTAIAPDAGGGYPDVRVIDARGNALPIAFDPARPTGGDRTVALIDVGFVPHRGTQGVIDLGGSGALVDAVSLEIDAGRRPTYLERVAIDASDDRRVWRVVRDDAIVYRVEQDGGHGSSTLTFPPTRSRWLRVRVLDPAAAFPLSGARVVAAASHDPALIALPLAGVRHDEPAAAGERFTFSAATAVRPAAVAFSDGGAFYQRHVTVEWSTDGTSWTGIGDATIAHYAEGGTATTVALTETTARTFRVTVDNGSDAPLASLRPVLLARPHDIVFAAGAAPYELLSGNPNEEAATYDLGARLAHEDWRAGDAQPAATVANPGYRDPRPVGERFPMLITGALVLVAFVLGAIGLRTVRRPTPE